jgi:hypothetical protein
VLEGDILELVEVVLVVIEIHTLLKVQVVVEVVKHLYLFLLEQHTQSQ